MATRNTRFKIIETLTGKLSVEAGKYYHLALESQPLWKNLI